MEKKAIRVLLADDHKIFRDGLNSMFDQMEEISIIAVASNGTEVLAKVKTLAPDVLLLDLSMPIMGGLEVLKALQNTDPKPEVLILSMHSEIEYIREALSSGANGYVSKEDTDKEELAEAIRTVHRKEEYFSKSIRKEMQYYLVNGLNDAAAPISQSPADLLSRREHEVLKLVLEGMSNQEIADATYVSIRTVETHKNNIMNKLNLKNTVELVKYAIKNNIFNV